MSNSGQWGGQPPGQWGGQGQWGQQQQQQQQPQQWQQQQQWQQPQPPQHVYYPVPAPMVIVQQKAPFNHGVHLIVDLFTCGAWLPIHLILWAAH